MIAANQRSAIFLDRDGVLNEDIGFLYRPAELRWIGGAREALRQINLAGALAIVVTNQSGVARGYYAEDDVRALHAHMAQSLAEIGARVDAFYYCPFHDEGAIPQYVVADHPDRKPNPGMLLRAIADFDIDPKRSLIIGDKASDIEAGRRAGVRGVLFSGGRMDALVAKELETLGVSSGVQDVISHKTNLADARSTKFVALGEHADQAIKGEERLFS